MALNEELGSRPYLYLWILQVSKLCSMQKEEELSMQWHNFAKKLEVAIFGHFVYTRARQNAQK